MNSFSIFFGFFAFVIPTMLQIEHSKVITVLALGKEKKGESTNKFQSVSPQLLSL